MAREEFAEYFEKQGGHVLSRNMQAAVRAVSRHLYEWGSLSAWEATEGLGQYKVRSLEVMEDMGLVGSYEYDGEKQVYITEAGMAFVERFELSPLAA